MAEPVKQRTYTVIPDVAVAAQGSLIATNRRLVRTIVNQLLAAGATCYYSCNGVTAGAAGDGVNRWAADADIVFGDAGSAHSWMILALPAGLGGQQLMISCAVMGGGATNGDVIAALSNPGYSGGNTTTDPVCATGLQPYPLLLTGGSGGQLPSGGNYSAKISTVYATDGTSIRVIVTADAADIVVSLLLLERLFDTPAAHTLPFAATWYHLDSLADLGNVVEWATWFGGEGSVSYASAVSFGYGPGLMVDNVVVTDGDTAYHLYPVGVTDGGNGWNGYIPDLFFLTNDGIGTTYRKTLPAAGGHRWACFGSIVVPWDGATALTGTINGHQLRMAPVTVTPDATPPVVSNVTPTPGTKLTTRTTPIVFDVTDTAPGLRLVLVTARYATVAGTFVVHDGTAFAYPFDTSTRVAITNGYRYTVVPRGGWLDDIADLHVYAVDQAGNLE